MKNAVAIATGVHVFQKIGDRSGRFGSVQLDFDHAETGGNAEIRRSMTDRGREKEAEEDVQVHGDGVGAGPVRSTRCQMVA